MRAVIGALLHKAQGARKRPQLRFRPARFHADPASTGEETSAPPCDGDTETVRGLLTRRCCLGLEREIPIRTAGKDGQASGANLWRAGETTEARSVVALSRVPR